MFTKPISLFVIFSLSIINFVFMMLPLTVILSPGWLVAKDFIVKHGIEVGYSLGFFISAIMLLYISLDMIFGITVRRLSKGTVPIRKMQSLLGHSEIVKMFDDLKTRFGVSKAQLFIDEDYQTVNAFAVGSFSLNRVIITMGLLNHIQSQCNSDKQYLIAVRGIIGHELSHLSNKDFLPGLLISANDTANKHVKFILHLFLNIFIRFFNLIPFIGSVIAAMIVLFYNMLAMAVSMFFVFIVMPIYSFIQKALSRSIEFRCDRESAYACGGNRMAFALSMLGAGSYFSIFSTHPRTQSRINHVQHITPKHGKIRPSILTSLANAVSVMGLFLLCGFFWKMAEFQTMGPEYIQLYYDIKGMMTLFIQELVTTVKSLGAGFN